MAGELGYYPTGPNAGKLIYSPNSTPAGKLARTCGGLYYKLTPCIEFAASSCAYCSDGTPKYLTVILSNIVNDTTTCWTVGGPSELKHVTLSNVNATYLLDQVATCQWQYHAVSSGGHAQLREPSGGTCTGALVSDAYETATEINVWKQVTAGHRWNIESHWEGMDPYGGIFTNQFYNNEPRCLTPVTIVRTDASSAEYPTSGGTIEIWPGDIYGGGRCPGGSAIYTDTDLSAYVGKAVTITADSPPVCYFVSQEGDHSDGGVTVATSFDTCALCCPTP